VFLGQTWYALGGAYAKQTTLPDFCEHAAATGEEVELLGFSRNSQLISRLLQHNVPVHLGTPRICFAYGRRIESPDMVFAAMSEFGRPTSVGGFRRASVSDRIACWLDCIQRGWEPEDGREAVADAHVLAPFFRAMQVPSCAWCSLVGTIRNPHWYIDIAAPARDGPLFAYLGLSPAVLESIRSLSQATPQQRRCHATLVCASHGYPAEQPLGVFARIRAARPHKLPSLLAIRAAQQFVRIVRALWLEHLRCPQQSALGLVQSGVVDSLLRPAEREALALEMQRC